MAIGLSSRVKRQGLGLGIRLYTVTTSTIVVRLCIDFRYLVIEREIKPCYRMF